MVVALSFTLAVVLIVRGNVLIGGIIAALAVTRVALFAQIHRRRKRFRARIEQRRAARFGGGRPQ